MAQRDVISLAFDQDDNKETAAMNVPDWARSAFVILPELNSGTTGLYHRFAADTAWGVRGFDLDGVANPRATYTGGSSTIDEIQWHDVKGATEIKVMSSAAQTGKSARIMFKA